MSQAIEAAIELNLNKVEAGAQGEHKVDRGYLPEMTYSCHYILDEGFRNVIQDFLVRETQQVILFLQYNFNRKALSEKIITSKVCELDPGSSHTSGLGVGVDSLLL